MNKTLLSVILSFFFGHPLVAVDGRWQQYSLNRYPISNVSCVQTAKDIGSKFEKATGQAVFRATCEKETKEGYDILLTYAAVAPVALVSTQNEAGGYGYLGVYSSLQDCQAGLTKEVGTFTKNTALTPFVSYCYKESGLSGTPYFARIDAFGDSLLHPYRFEDNVFASSIADREKVLQSVLAAAKSANIQVHQATLANDGLTKLVIRYYFSPKEIAFHTNLFRLDSPARYSAAGTRDPLAVCASQLKDGEEGFSKVFGTAGIWFCTWDNTLFQARLYLLRVQPQEGATTDTLPDRFANFAECDAERAHAKAWYEKSFGIIPFAVLCSWKSGFGTGKSDAFVLKVLTKLPELEPPGGLDPDLGSFKEKIL